MKLLRIVLIVILFPLLTASTSHKFYVSITKIEYAQEDESLQIISTIFIDDIEDALQERYRKDVSIATTKETEADALLMKQYILQKLNIEVNGEEVKLNFLGTEYDVDVVKAYIEVEGITSFESIQVENKVLLDMFDEQQNIIHVKNGKTRRSLVLERDNPKGLLNFN